MAPPKSRKPAASKKEYIENPDYGTVFQREDAQGRQPQMTGEGVLSQETIDAVTAADGNFQISIWTRGRDGNAMRNRNGTYRFRFHIEPPYQADKGDEADTPGDMDDDLPF